MKQNAKKWSDVFFRLHQRQHILLFILAQILTVSVFAQVSVTGTVRNPGGEAIAKANVLLKGTTNGVTTDDDGHFRINVPDNKGVLVISYMGLKSQEVDIAGRSVIEITLQDEISELKGVVVVGYGTQSRDAVTTSISKLDTKVLENIPFANPAAAMQGTISGVRVQGVSGQPGTAPRVIVRGGTSINNPDGATPLYIVDGVIRTNLNDINAADIESLQVLKDAAATAIYGARGSNGVVIVVTKSGKPGPTRVTYNYDLSASQVGKRYDLLNARDFLYYQRLGIKATAKYVPAYEDVLTGTTYPGGTGNDLTNDTWESVQYLTPDNAYKLTQGWDTMPDPLDPARTLLFSNTDWQDVLFRTAISHNHTLSVSGGSDKANYSVGLGYLNAQGIAATTDYKRLSLNLHAGIKVTDDIRVYTQVMLSNSINHAVFSEGTIFKSSLILPPTAKRYFEDGTLSPGQGLSYGNTEYTLTTYNPKNSTDNLTVVLGAQWKILKGLTFDPRVSFFQQTAYSRNFQEAYLNGPLTMNTTRAASATYSKQLDPQAEAILTYNTSIKGDHNIEAKAGFSYFRSNTQSIGANGNQAATDLIPTLNASGTPVSVTGAETEQVIVGYFGRATYDYKQKYLFNASIRYDGASNLGQNNKWGLFPGVSLGWNLHKENFWQIFPEDLLSLKLRASYGVNGNINGLGLYQAQGSYSTGIRYSGQAAIQNTVLPNSNLQWEQSKTLDFGMDIGLFNNRVGILFDVYRRVTDNLLTNLNMPLSTGFTSILTNFGSLENKGIEVEVSVRPLPADSRFQWNLAFNTSNVKNKILKLPFNGIENNRVGGEFVYDREKGAYTWLGGLQEGGRIGDLFGFKQMRIYSTDEEAANGPVDMLVPRPDKTKFGGDVDWLDVDQNDTIDTRDRVYLGNIYPHFTGGISNTFSYGGLNLYVRLDYTVGHTINFETGGRIEGNFSGVNAIGSNIARSWKNQGDITDIPRYYFADQNAQWNVWNGRASSRFFPKGDFLCLREVTLSYNLPGNILQRYKVNNLRFNITGSNLVYFTKYPGLNPEASGTDTAYPNPRNITFGASITF